jgi:hypothetical protein
MIELNKLQKLPSTMMLQRVDPKKKRTERNPR